jgi:molybdopterin-binding protein
MWVDSANRAPPVRYVYRRKVEEVITKKIFREKSFSVPAGGRLGAVITNVSVDTSGLHAGKVWLVLSDTGDTYDRVPALLTQEQAAEIGMALIQASAAASVEESL